MKKNLFYISLMAIAICLATTSCGGDDDNQASESKTLNISDFIGTWRNTSSRGNFCIFNADGTCEWGSNSTYSNWELKSGGLLLLTRTDGRRVDEYTAEYKNNQLHLTYPDGSATEYNVLERVDIEKIMSSVTKSSFLGSWKISLQKYTQMKWDFIYDGSCKYDDGVSIGNGTWSYNPETRVLTTKANLYYIANGKYSSTINREWKILYVTTDEWEGQGFAYQRVK